MDRLIFLLFIAVFYSSSLFAIEPVTSLKQIKNFHAVSDKLSSSGMLALSDYQYIKENGFKHVINLIPGDQAEEKNYVLALGLSYEQIEVDWNEPTLQDFERFTNLMKQYKNDKVYVHCQANYRASSFVYLYRVTQLGVEEESAKKDLHAVWQPTDSWLGFIEKVLFELSD